MVYEGLLRKLFYLETFLSNLCSHGRLSSSSEWTKNQKKKKIRDVSWYFKYVEMSKKNLLDVGVDPIRV
jgi:hypothetical protein